MKGETVKPSTANFVKAFGLITLGAAVCLAGIYIGETDDAPGAALIGILLMIAMVALGVKIMRRKV